MERVTAKSFVVSFALVTALCIMDLAIFGLAKQYGIDLPYGSALSYGMIIGLYSVCIVECLGLSLLVQVGRSVVAYYK